RRGNVLRHSARRAETSQSTDLPDGDEHGDEPDRLRTRLLGTVRAPSVRSALGGPYAARRATGLTGTRSVTPDPVVESPDTLTRRRPRSARLVSTSFPLSPRHRQRLAGSTGSVHRRRVRCWSSSSRTSQSAAPRSFDGPWRKRW